MSCETSVLGDYLLPVRSITPHTELGECEFTYLDIASVDRGLKQITEPQVLTTAAAPSRARQIVASGDVLVSTVRPNLNTVAVVDDAYGDAIASTGFSVLRANSRYLDKRFLFHWVSSEKTVQTLVKLATGASYPAVSDKIIKSLPIGLPPLEEQKRVATILDRADVLRRKRQEATRLEGKFLRALFINTFGDFDSNPKRFERGTIRDLVASANYGTSQKADENIGKYPILRMNNITYEGGWDFSSLKYVDLDEKTAHKYLARKGDLLFNRTNSKELVGKTAVFMGDQPMAVAGYLVRVRMNEHGNAQYVAGYLNSAHGKRTLEGRAKSIVGMANINAQELQDIPILLPPKALQDKFAGIVEAVQSRIEKQRQFLMEADDLMRALSRQLLS